MFQRTPICNPASIPALTTAILATTVTAPAHAQGLILEEIIVTAQKRAETVHDISATVNVLGADQLTKNAAFTFADIEQLTAGLSLTVKNARNQTISLRGVSCDPEANAAPGVDTYFNGMKTRSDVAFNQLFDLERIEILRGPQGSLQGATSPAGAMKAIPKSCASPLKTTTALNICSAYITPTKKRKPSLYQTRRRLDLVL